MKKTMAHFVLCSATFTLFAAPPSALAWGSNGHQIVGGLADQLLVGTPAAKKVKQILGTLNLSQVSIWADCARSVKAKNHYQHQNEGFHDLNCVPFETPEGKLAMADFVKRHETTCSKKDCHTEFHYANVPIQASNYQAGGVGTNTHDVVQAILAAGKKLRGQSSAPFQFASDKEALMLLVHYVGDLHQPLHLGSVYLQEDGKLLDPRTSSFTVENHSFGGNSLHPSADEEDDLHGRWDAVSKETRLTALAANSAWLQQAKASAKSTGASANWPRAWATQSLQQAQLAFAGISYQSKHDKNWPIRLPANYTSQLHAIQQQQMILAGAHLAQLLQAIWPR